MWCLWALSLHPWPVGLHIQTKVSEEWQGKDVAQVSATPSHLPWHKSESCCSGLSGGLLWWGRRGLCWLCEALCPLQLIQSTFCPEVTLWPMLFQTIATGKPCPSSLTLFLLPFFSLDWAPLPESSRNMLMGISCQDSSCYASRSQEDISHFTKLLHHWWSPWGSGRVRAQVGLLSHSCSNTQRVTLGFQFWTFGCSVPVCLSMCCVCREGVILMFFRTTHFLALFVPLFIALLLH